MVASVPAAAQEVYRHYRVYRWNPGKGGVELAQDWVSYDIQ